MGMESRPCPCGSGKDSFWAHDARGIPLCRTCDDCHEKKMSKYRPEIFNHQKTYSDGMNEFGERIESDY